MVIYAAPQKSPKLFVSLMYRVARSSVSCPVVGQQWDTPRAVPMTSFKFNARYHKAGNTTTVTTDDNYIALE